MRVLVIEDERKTAAFIKKALVSEGFTVDHFVDGSLALAAILAHPFDAVVLDIMIPGIDGLSVLRRMRAARCPVPVLLLSARGDVEERIEGLNAGADDYLAKPFALGELIARVRALCRRAPERNILVMEVGGLRMNLSTREVTRDGVRIELSQREFALLDFLMRNQGRVCTRMQLIEKVWNFDFDPGTNLVDVYIRRLRDKIDHGHSVKLLHTVRGIGYVLKLKDPTSS